MYAFWLSYSSYDNYEEIDLRPKSSDTLTINYLLTVGITEISNSNLYHACLSLVAKSLEDFSNDVASIMLASSRYLMTFIAQRVAMDVKNV